MRSADEIVAAVKEHMWEGHCYCLSDYGCSEPSCIACANHKEHGHKDDCWLAKVLGQ